MTTRTWDVLLIGGPSGAGKSSISYPLAARHGVPVLELDDIVCALRAMTTPGQQPELFWWETHPEAFRLPAADIMRQGLDLSRSLEPAFAAVIANHLETDMPVVIDGDYLLPAFMAAQARLSDRVRGLIVSEPDVDQIVANYTLREPADGEQWKRAEVSVAWNSWLTAEAVSHDVPVVPARPWPDALARALDSCSGRNCSTLRATNQD